MSLGKTDWKSLREARRVPDSSVLDSWVHLLTLRIAMSEVKEASCFLLIQNHKDSRIWLFILLPPSPLRASLVAHLVKNLPAMRETWVWSLGWEDPLEKGKATHSSILAWRIPWTVYSPWGRKELDMTEWLLTHFWPLKIVKDFSSVFAVFRTQIWLFSL